jgi:hypothetical protein
MCEYHLIQTICPSCTSFRRPQAAIFAVQPKITTCSRFEKQTKKGKATFATRTIKPDLSSKTYELRLPDCKERAHIKGRDKFVEQKCKYCQAMEDRGAKWDNMRCAFVLKGKVVEDVDAEGNWPGKGEEGERKGRSKGYADHVVGPEDVDAYLAKYYP